MRRSRPSSSFLLEPSALARIELSEGRANRAGGGSQKVDLLVTERVVELDALSHRRTQHRPRARPHAAKR